jgi:hypothetical protein
MAREFGQPATGTRAQFLTSAMLIRGERFGQQLFERRLVSVRLILRAGQGNLSRAKRHHDPPVGQYVQTSRHPSFPEIQRSNALAAADSLDFLRRHSRRRSSSLLGVSCPPASEKGQKIGNQFTFIELVDDLAMPIPNATTNRAHSIQLRSNITLDSGR